MKQKIVVVKLAARLEMRRTEPIPDDLKRWTRGLATQLRRRYPDADERRVVRDRLLQELNV